MYSKNGKILNINKSRIGKPFSGTLPVENTPTLQLQANTLPDQKILLDGINVLEWQDVRNKHVAYADQANKPVYDFTEQSLYCSGLTGQGLAIKDHSDFNFGSEGSISFYCNLDDLLAIRYLLGKFEDGNNYLAIYMRVTDTLSFTLRSGGVTHVNILGITASDGLTANDWHHISYYWKGSIVMAVLDGKIIGKIGIVGTISGNNAIMTLFKRDGFFFLKGFLDDIIFSNVSKYDPADYSVSDQIFTPKPRNFPNL